MSLGLLMPCLTCGELSEQSRCPEHTKEHNNAGARQRGWKPKSPEARARDNEKYDAAWKRLSKRARRTQTYCSDCGATDDLTTDHSAEAWRRRAAGKPIRLQDVDVVCRSCNAKRGQPQ